MLRRTSCEHCQSERRGRWDVVYQWSNPAAFVPVGIHRRVCWCGNWSEPRSDLGTGLQHKAGRRERTRKHLVLQWQFGCRWQPGSALFASHREHLHVFCGCSVSPSVCSASFKCVLFARSPYKNTSFPELGFTSVETRHRRSPRVSGAARCGTTGTDSACCHGPDK